MDDFRIYFYTSGTLQKHPRFKKSYKTLEDAENIIGLYKYNKNYQWVITQYYGAYNSKIVKIIERENEN